MTNTPLRTPYALLALMPWLAAHAGAVPPGRIVAMFDATDPASFGYAHGAKPHAFTATEIPENRLRAAAPERHVFTADDILRMRFTGLRPDAAYTVRLTFFSDTERTIHLHAGPLSLLSDLRIPALTKVEKTVTVPAEAYKNGALRLAFAGQGKQPVISRIEVFSENPAALRMEPDTPTLLAALSPALPRLSPRPKTVDGVVEPRMSLDGVWRFRSSPDATEVPINVPGEWAMQGFTVKAGEPAIYRKRIPLPADWAGRRVKLRFDAVSAECVVRVNGRDIGAHAGGFVPFEFDITDALKPGEENTLEVAVRSETTADTLATLSQYAAHPVGGLLRSVSLFALPEVNLAAVDTTTAFDAAYRDATLTVSAELANESPLRPADAELVATLTAPDGTPVELGAAATATVTGITAGGKRPVTLKLPVPSARAWDTEHPHLYTLELAVRRDGKTLATTTRRIGLRTVALDGARMLINGKPVKLLGACRHEIDPLSGRSITAAQCRRDAELFRAGNANFLRTSHYPPSEAFLDACDELGILVEAEAAVCWVKHHANPAWTKWDHEDPQFFPPIVTANLDNIAANRGHPSVVLWSLANESRWSRIFERVDAVVRQADPSRPTAFHDQCWGGFNNAGSKSQVAVFHYPGDNGPAECDKTSDRPTYFGEYVHVQCYNRREWHTDPFVRADWGRPLARMVDKMWAHPNCLGGAIWAGVDDLFHLPESIGGDLVGYGPWGVIDGWRREKPEYAGMKNAYARIRITGPVVFSDGAWRFRVQNRYDFADLAEVPLTWRCGAQRGVAKFEAPPHGEAEIVIRPPSPPKPDDTLHLTFTDPRGFVALEREIGARADDAGFGAPVAPAKTVALDESPAAYTVRAPHTTVTLDRASGVLTIDDVSGKRRLLGTPVPMSLELNGSGGASGPAGSIFVNRLEPFTPVDTAWKTSAVRATRLSPTAVRLDIDGANKDAAGTVSLTVDGDGALTFRYDTTSARDLNPRQRGLAFELPRDFDTLRWLRAAEDASFDPHDIARKRGAARANPTSSPLVTEPRKRPETPWALDSSPLGTNDFRSTKAGILAASLTDAAGAGLAVRSDGSQSVRAWVDGDRIRLLVADFNTGGSDGFCNTHYAAERRPVKKGDKLAGTVTLRALTAN